MFSNETVGVLRRSSRRGGRGSGSNSHTAFDDEQQSGDQVPPLMLICAKQRSRSDCSLAWKATAPRRAARGDGRTLGGPLRFSTSVVAVASR
jgi:hypothetical protein